MSKKAVPGAAADAAGVTVVAAPTQMEECVVHPLVLLNCVDHYNRVAKDTSKRVIGVLLGNRFKGTVDATNSFAVPFEEDRRDPNVWYLDHNYLETMENMFRKVDARERIVGFYSTGPKVRSNDLQINELFRKYVAHPVFVIIDVRTDFEGVPIKAYTAVEALQEDGKETRLEFRHVPSVIGATQSEEVGVEHLLRDINDPSVSTLAATIKHKVGALRGLRESLEEMRSYLERVLAGELAPNNQIMYNLQTIFNLMPNLQVESLSQAFVTKSNDMHLTLYLSSLVRSVTALHELVQNKIQFKDELDGEENGEAADAKKADDAAEAKEDSKEGEKKSG